MHVCIFFLDVLDDLRVSIPFYYSVKFFLNIEYYALLFTGRC